MSMSWGILGSRNHLTKQIIQDKILTPILHDVGSMPSEIILPSEPLSSSYIECWAIRNEIPVTMKKSNWVQYGKKAGILRDAEIQKEAGILIVFEGPRSRFYLTLAERLLRKNPFRRIYVVESKSVSPILLEIETKYMIQDEEEEDILRV